MAKLKNTKLNAFSGENVKNPIKLFYAHTSLAVYLCTTSKLHIETENKSKDLAYATKIKAQINRDTGLLMGYSSYNTINIFYPQQYHFTVKIIMHTSNYLSNYREKVQLQT